MLLPILYWVILVLSVIGLFIPTTTWSHGRYLNGLAIIVLFVIVGLKIFRVAL